MVTVFDRTARTDASPKKRAESIFTYRNRSARPGDVTSRALIEDWFSRTPSPEREELRARFRCDDEIDCSPFQELCLHELLLRQQCTLVPHPRLVGTEKGPDDLVSQPEGADFIVEATSAN